MKFKLTPIVFSDGKKGKRIISPHISQHEKLSGWITDKHFVQYMHEEYRLQRHTRKRNTLYSFHHPILDQEVILKVSVIGKQIKLLRRINLMLSTLLSDYNFSAFKGAMLLNETGVRCAIPVMYWTESGLSLERKSYYMYKKVQATHTLLTFAEHLVSNNRQSSADIYKQLADKTVNIVKRIHAAGFRQGDPHPGNFLVTHAAQPSDRSDNETDLDNIRIYIIDLDKFKVAKPLGKTLKRFFDLRCMRRCTLGPYDQVDMLKFYLQDEYSDIWKMVLWFWMRGGGNPYKWFGRRKRGM